MSELLESDNTEVLILDWTNLSFEQRNDRIEWLRHTMEAGKDWGYCEAAVTCVIMNIEAACMYRLRWFEAGNQSLIDRPRLLTPGGPSTMYY